MFTLENTTGYSQDQLNEMNIELEMEIAKWSSKNPDDDDIIQIEKICSDIIFKKHC